MQSVPPTVAGTLADAGFDDEEISEALNWLSELREIATEPMALAPQPDSMRIFTAEEQNRLDIECRGFLAFLEASGALDAGTREFVIGRALSLDGFRLDAIPYLATILILVFATFGRNRRHKTPASLGLPYFREER